MRIQEIHQISQFNSIQIKYNKIIKNRNRTMSQMRDNQNKLSVR